MRRIARPAAVPFNHLPYPYEWASLMTSPTQFSAVVDRSSLLSRTSDSGNRLTAATRFSLAHANF
jgi:hypothetical protein